MAKTPGKIGRGIQETSVSLIAGEEVLFGQPVEYDTSNDAKGNRYDSGNIGDGGMMAGAALYDPSAGTDDNRRYEADDTVEILKEGTAKVRINRDWALGENSYYGYLTKGDPVYAVPGSYFDDGRTYFATAPDDFFNGSGICADNAGNVSSGYFGDPVGEAKETTINEGDKCVIDVEFNLPNVN